MQDKPTVFLNHKLQKLFLKDGYVLLSNLLDSNDIASLMDVYREYQQEIAAPFHTTHFSKNITYKRAAHNAISKVVFKKIAPFLSNYQPLFGNFMVKNPDPNIALDIHTDWTYVDESTDTSLSIWVPLTDTNLQNGCLGVVKGSHQISNAIRGPLIRESSRNHNDLWASRFGSLLPMQAGDAILYHHGLLHFSPPNKSTQARPAVNLTVVPQGVNYMHYCLPEGATAIEQYSVPNSDFYINYNHFERPPSPTLVKTIPIGEIKFIDPKMKNFRLKRLIRNLCKLSV